MKYRLEALTMILQALPGKPGLPEPHRLRLINKIAVRLDESIRNWQKFESYAIDFPENVIGSSPFELRREAKAMLNARQREAAGKPRKGSPEKPMSWHLSRHVDGSTESLQALINRPKLPAGKADNGEADLIVLDLCSIVKGITSVKPAINLGDAPGKFGSLLREVGELYKVNLMDRSRVTRIVRRWRKCPSQIVF